MSQRVSGYARKENDLYETPAWVTRALLVHIKIQPLMRVLEPAAGNGAIADVLRTAGLEVYACDISNGIDFLRDVFMPVHEPKAIITNPPYGKAEEFIARALDLTEPHGLVAMLLRTDFDHAATRRYLFDEPFSKKVVLTKRIRWFPESTGSPSFNHAWFIWDWQHQGAPTLAYA